MTTLENAGYLCAMFGIIILALGFILKPTTVETEPDVSYDDEGSKITKVYWVQYRWDRIFKALGTIAILTSGVIELIVYCISVT